MTNDGWHDANRVHVNGGRVYETPSCQDCKNFQVRYPQNRRCGVHPALHMPMMPQG